MVTNSRKGEVRIAIIRVGDCIRMSINREEVSLPTDDLVGILKEDNVNAYINDLRVGSEVSIK